MDISVIQINPNGGTYMEKNGINPENPLEVSDEEKKEEFIDVFKYFEESNAANRAAFSELLKYTYKNRRDPKR